jgi:hypothetical protein
LEKQVHVVTFISSDPECPDNQKVIARIRPKIPSKGGVLKMDWHPVIFHAESEEAATLQAKAFWERELAKVRAREAHYRSLSEARKAKAALKVVSVPASEVKIEKTEPPRGPPPKPPGLKPPGVPKAPTPKPPAAPPAPGKLKPPSSFKIPKKD